MIRLARSTWARTQTWCLWDGYPLSTYGIPQKVWIDGDVYFDRELPGFGMPQYQEGQ